MRRFTQLAKVGRNGTTGRQWTRGSYLATKNDTIPTPVQGLRYLLSPSNKDTSPETTETTEQNEDSSSLPWYLRETPSVDLMEEERAPIPPVPQNAPKSLEEFLTLLSVEYGLQEIELYDLNTLEAEHPNSTENQPFDYMVICTGKSEKHIFKAGQELKHYIKHNYSAAANINGLVSSAPSPVARRRMFKRANKAPLATDNDYGRSANSWVMCETNVDGICVHVLTKERREELNLESLWVSEETGEQATEPASDKTKSWTDRVPYFFQSRRHYHTTSKRTLSTVSKESLTSVYNKVHEANLAELDREVVTKAIDEFESSFVSPKINDYNLRNKFYALIHVFYPDIISLEKLNDIFLGKYSDLSIALDANVNMKTEKDKDVPEYIKVLLDSSELRSQHDPKVVSDKCYHLLSQFLINIYRFSDDKIDFESSPELIPLLWKLTCPVNGSDGTTLGPSAIDAVLYDNNEQMYTETFATTVQAKNRARDITELLNFYFSTSPENTTLSRSVKEFQLLTFGNSGNWKEFWNHWNLSMNFLDGKQDFQKWIRLVIYLALRNDKAASKTFVTDYWKNPNTISGTFLQQYQSHGALLSPTERFHLKLALAKITTQVDGLNSSKLDEMRNFINQL